MGTLKKIKQFIFYFRILAHLFFFLFDIIVYKTFRPIKSIKVLFKLQKATDFSIVNPFKSNFFSFLIF